MKAEIFNLKGRIDSTNAAALEQELLQTAADELVINAENLEYISSAGLRVLMKLQKSRKAPIVVTQVSPEVYSIFEMTGFTEIMDIRKALRKIDVEENELIAKGTIGTIYRIDDDTVVKVFGNRITTDLILREREYARKAFLAGIPTIITYDIVTVKDRLGIVLEMAKGSALSEKLNNEANDRNQLVRDYAELLRSIHSTRMAKGEFPAAKDIYHGYVDAAVYLNKEQREALHRVVDAVPDAVTVLHGDYHANNVMFQGGEMVVIDLSDISLGNPLFDLASMYVSHIAVGGYHPEFIRAGMGISYETCQQLWKGFFDQYFAQSTPEERARKEDVVRRFAMLKLSLMYAIAPGLDQLLGWQPLEDAGKILFDGQSRETLLKDIREFGC